MKLLNKVSLITGAGSGMGRASALLFSAEGAKVSVADIDKKSGEQTADLIKQKGGEAIFIQADVAKAADVERMITTTVKTYGRLDILFNNAGLPMSFTPIEEVEEELWDRIMNVNVKSIFLSAKYAVPHMKKQGGGAIVNTASIIGIRARPKMSAYTASKGAAIMLTKQLAIELAPFRIRVNCVNPVATETPMLAQFIGKGDLEEGRKSYIASIPLGRLAQPEDIARAALYLVSDDASIVTGACLDVDGGRGI
jgi:3-oxoacyl-[acyl-carrier protein] reductase